MSTSSASRRLASFLVLTVCVVCCECQLQDFFRNFLRIFQAGDGGIEDTDVLLEQYDFIIVGAGSAGCVMANRLTEIPNWKVLLIEAGETETFLSDVPLMASMQSRTRFNWAFESEQLTTACLGLERGRCHLARGKAVGGTSVINFMLYTRGNRKDYDMWSEQGNHGWSYEEVLPYFLKSENCSTCEEIDEAYHGTEGYLNVEHPHYESPLVKLFVKAGQEMGYKNNDPNGKYELGFSRVQATMKRGTRCSASKAFIKPILHRPNFHISTKSMVTKILIDSETKTAYGVEFLKNKKKHVAYAKKEVILSAGSINSPQILMLSGIGPKDHLETLGIPVIQDLKVGYNFQDHMAMSALAFFVNESITVSDWSVQNPIDIYNYISRGSGPYTIPGGAEALAFVKTKYASKTNDDYPDMELVLGAGALNGDIFGNFRHLLGIPDSTYRQVFLPHLGKPSFGIATVLLRPKSRGRIWLRDANPLSYPIINPNYYEKEEDLATMVEGIKMAIAISRSTPFQTYQATPNDLPFPGCDHLLLGGDEYWACAARSVSTTLGHHVGTCKMGPRADEQSVVDQRLRVHGIGGLRVVDGSIMPTIVAGHTNAVIFMIGEKASDMVKKYWRDEVE
ncbi:unnamed protein product [Phaedon cochleariae]|uniref:Glucose-methanol-choline oxidoreductase N-terminal domain-containing protein n=1 Tax=Phaedon cochleariae TaxID=80249 RepID=A0A9P0DHD7_PHACE|nr:unnamed protein product [Phaedon cochleariae]